MLLPLHFYCKHIVHTNVVARSQKIDPLISLMGTSKKLPIVITIRLSQFQLDRITLRPASSALKYFFLKNKNRGFPAINLEWIIL